MARSPNLSGLQQAFAGLQQANALKAAREKAAQDRASGRRANKLRTIGTVGGAIVGGIYGGPAGAAAGASMGNTAGGIIAQGQGDGEVSSQEVAGTIGTASNFKTTETQNAEAAQRAKDQQQERDLRKARIDQMNRQGAAKPAAPADPARNIELATIQQGVSVLGSIFEKPQERRANIPQQSGGQITPGVNIGRDQESRGSIRNGGLQAETDVANARIDEENAQTDALNQEIVGIGSDLNKSFTTAQRDTTGGSSKLTLERSLNRQDNLKRLPGLIKGKPRSEQRDIVAQARPILELPQKDFNTEMGIVESKPKATVVMSTNPDTGVTTRTITQPNGNVTIKDIATPADVTATKNAIYGIEKKDIPEDQRKAIKSLIANKGTTVKEFQDIVARAIPGGDKGEGAFVNVIPKGATKPEDVVTLQKGTPEFEKAMAEGGTLASGQMASRFPTEDKAEKARLAKTENNIRANTAHTKNLNSDDFLPKTLLNIREAAATGATTPTEFRAFVKEAKSADLNSSGKITKSTTRMLEQKVIASEVTLRQLDSLKAKLAESPEVLTYEGKFKNWFTSVKEKMRLSDAKDKNSLMSIATDSINKLTNVTPEERKKLYLSANMAQENEQMFNVYRQMITGAQASHSELMRLMKTIPNMSDSASVYMGKLQSMTDGMNRFNKFYRNTLDNGINPDKGEGAARVNEQFKYASNFADKAKELSTDPKWASLNAVQRSAWVSKEIPKPADYTDDERFKDTPLTLNALFGGNNEDANGKPLFNPFEIVGGEMPSGGS